MNRVDKVIALVRSASGAADQQQRDAVWQEVDAASRSLALTQPGIAGLVVSRVIRPFADADPLLALVEIWAESTDADALLDIIIPAAVRDSRALTVTTATCSVIVLRQVLDYARPDSRWSIKLAGTAMRRADFEPDAFFEYWTNVHAPIGRNVPGVGGYTVSRVREGRIGEEAADAIIEQWYVNEQAFDDAQSTEPAQAAWADVSNYAMTTGVAFWLMTETVIIEPPATGLGTLDL